MPDTSQNITRLLANLEIFVIALLVGLSIADGRFLLPAVLAAVLFQVLGRFTPVHWAVRTPVDLPVVLLVLACGVNAAISVDRAVSLPQILRLLAGLGLMYAIVNRVGNSKTLRIAQFTIIGLGLVFVAVALVTVDWADNKLPFIPVEIYALLPTLNVDLIHPNVLGGILLLFAPHAAAAALWGRPFKSWEPWAAGLVLLVIAGVMVLSQSRSALLALGLAGLLLIGLRWRWGWILVLGAGAGAAWAVSQLGIYNMTDLLFGSRIFGGFQGRTEIWGRGIFMLQDFSFTGVGMGLFPLVAEKIYPFFSISDVTIQHAHNLFIQVGVDLGLPGLAAFLAIFLTVTWIGLMLYRSGTELRAVGAGILAVQLGLLVHGLFDAVVWGQVRGAPLLWVVWGFALAAWNIAVKNQRP